MNDGDFLVMFFIRVIEILSVKGFILMYVILLREDAYFMVNHLAVFEKWKL